MPDADEIHIWEFPPESSYLRLNPNFQRELVEKAVEKAGSMKKVACAINAVSTKYGCHSAYGAGNVHDWKEGKMEKGNRRAVLMPLWVALELIDFETEKENERLSLRIMLEKQIVSYQEYERGTPIFSPKLPIHITPEFDSIIFHLMGDGSWGGKGKPGSYRQKNKIGRDNFAAKLTNVFGIFKIDTYESDVELKICIPRIIIRIIEAYYGLQRPEAKERVPTRIMSRNKWHKLAGLLAFMVDEGHVGDSIEIYQSNKGRLDDLRNICLELGYACSEVGLKARAGTDKHKLDHYRLRLSLTAVEKLQKDIARLSKLYPTCYLAQKQEKMELIVERRTRKRRKGENGETKAQIIKMLECGPATVGELGKELCIGGQTICEHLNQLEESGRIVKMGKNKNAVIWKLVNSLPIASAPAAGCVSDTRKEEAPVGPGARQEPLTTC